MAALKAIHLDSLLAPHWDVQKDNSKAPQKAESKAVLMVAWSGLLKDNCWGLQKAGSMVLQMAQKMGLPMERKSVVQRADQKVTQRDTMKDLPMAGHWGNMKAVCWGYKMVAHWAEQKVDQTVGLLVDR